MSDLRDRILVVDDSELVRKLVIDVLSRSGYDVVTAESAESALMVLASDLPDLVVSDVSMPGMDGYELCRRLKSDSRTELHCRSSCSPRRVTSMRRSVVSRPGQTTISSNHLIRRS